MTSGSPGRGETLCISPCCKVPAAIPEGSSPIDWIPCSKQLRPLARKGRYML